LGGNYFTDLNFVEGDNAGDANAKSVDYILVNRFFLCTKVVVNSLGTSGTAPNLQQFSAGAVFDSDGSGGFTTYFCDGSSVHTAPGSGGGGGGIAQ
jgi:hypothetical protein